MSQGISLHIGLNHVNPDAYNGWDGALAGCINDANAMYQIAISQGFDGQKLIDSQATSSNVVSKIAEISGQLQSGDIFLLTYSGHGGQLPDLSGEEEDGMDETWVLWDRELLDNELYALWSRFANGVRIFVSSDSCHSGTVVKMMYRNQMQQRNRIIDVNALKEAVQRSQDVSKQFISFSSGLGPVVSEPKKRFIPIDVSMRSFETKRDTYAYCANMAGKKSNNQINAQLIFISGCQDNQFSYDGDQNGLFTSKLMEVWSNGGFSGSHQNFYNAICAKMPSYQTPNFMTLGLPINGFINQRPYTVQFAGSGTSGGTQTGTQGTEVSSSKPSVTIPHSWGRNNTAPVLQIQKGVNPYYYVEIANDSGLFNINEHGNDRNATNFYATWNDPAVSNRLTETAFQLPALAWNNLKNNNKLYFKVGTTSSADPYTWDNHMVSVADNELQNAPEMLIVADQVSPSPGPGASGTPTVNTESTISASVGRGGVNRQADVLKVQQLLNNVPENQGGPSSMLVEDGLIGKKTIRAIEDYQEFIGINPDGIISPGGTTISKLTARAFVYTS